MKFKPNKKSGGVKVELKRGEAELLSAATVSVNEPLPIFQLRRILVPVDFSDCSMKALQYAIPFARQFHASLILLHVVQPYLPVPEMSTVDGGLIEAQLREGSARQLEALKRKVAVEAPVETELRVGSPYSEIVNAIQSLRIDLILLSTHGRTGLAHVFLGSVTERVVRHASCPVLVVREGEHEFIATRSASAAVQSRAKKRE